MAHCTALRYTVEYLLRALGVSEAGADEEELQVLPHSTPAPLRGEEDPLMPALMPAPLLCYTPPLLHSSFAAPLLCCTPPLLHPSGLP